MYMTIFKYRRHNKLIENSVGIWKRSKFFHVTPWNKWRLNFISGKRIHLFRAMKNCQDSDTQQKLRNTSLPE